MQRARERGARRAGCCRRSATPSAFCAACGRAGAKHPRRPSAGPREQQQHRVEARGAGAPPRLDGHRARARHRRARVPRARDGARRAAGASDGRQPGAPRSLNASTTPLHGARVGEPRRTTGDAAGSGRDAPDPGASARAARVAQRRGRGRRSRRTPTGSSSASASSDGVADAAEHGASIRPGCTRPRGRGRRGAARGEPLLLRGEEGGVDAGVLPAAARRSAAARAPSASSTRMPSDRVAADDLHAAGQRAERLVPAADAVAGRRRSPSPIRDERDDRRRVDPRRIDERRVADRRASAARRARSGTRSASRMMPIIQQPRAARRSAWPTSSRAPSRETSSDTHRAVEVRRGDRMRRCRRRANAMSDAGRAGRHGPDVARGRRSTGSMRPARWSTPQRVGVRRARATRRRAGTHRDRSGLPRPRARGSRRAATAPRRPPRVRAGARRTVRAEEAEAVRRRARAVVAVTGSTRVGGRSVVRHVDGEACRPSSRRRSSP